MNAKLIRFERARYAKYEIKGPGVRNGAIHEIGIGGAGGDPVEWRAEFDVARQVEDTTDFSKSVTTSYRIKAPTLEALKARILAAAGGEL